MGRLFHTVGYASGFGGHGWSKTVESQWFDMLKS